MPRSKLFATLTVALLGAAALWYLWVIISAKLEWGGASPDQRTLGTVQATEQRAMAQYCTGVVVTPKATWLVARLDERSTAEPVAAGVQDLDALVRGQPTPEEIEEEQGSGAFSAYFVRGEKELTSISRLDANGQFQTVAQLSEAACLVASPDGQQVFLLTGLKRPAPAKGSTDSLAQTVVLRSDDQGQSWNWLRQGLFPEVEQQAWSLQTYFHGTDDVWAWGRPESLDDVIDQDQPRALSTGVSYSADRGASSAPIFTAESLLLTGAYARAKRPEIVQWQDEAEGHGEINTQISQMDGQHAVIWVSQRFWGRNPDGVGDNLAFNVTTRAPLSREAGGPWQVGAVQHEDGLYIGQLRDNGTGRLVGLIDQGNQGRDEVAELDAEQRTWKVLGALPNVFAPLSSDRPVRVSQFQVGRNSLLINTSSEHHPPRWLYWGADASISADGVFYSRDWGHSWQQLAIGGYLGILGFQGAEDRVIWAKGNWYDSRDLGIYTYGLK
ncbi:MAG: hypothetical protein P0Y51_14640 [Candidatus Pseudomonas colombiensis]|nr:MAG: hypothetical protein P0Y51_14640 [Pseudomonas sp.]